MQQMIEAHHGTISIESIEEKGTKVTVNLPIDRVVLENDPNILFVDSEELTEVEPELIEQLKMDGNAVKMESLHTLPEKLGSL